ncbi:unnamed protein product [Cylindrotheca closterium]|uniref:Uncharacterized protein n=1 Tax=Cylindrotheca closterium TaxID=2856 RepID=A0AAD2CFU5_9STRA|nr:unnamed protein product [Cylindrotheca closterium]
MSSPSTSSTIPRVRLFRNRNRPRSQIDIRVGSSHIVETLLHLRREDYPWYLANEEEINEEFLELLQESIIPRMFDVELEEYHNQLSPELMPLPEDQVGSKNTKSLNMAIANQKGRNNRKGRKKKISKTESQQQQAELKQQRTQEKLAKEISYAFGSTIQMAYRLQPLNSKSGQAYDQRTLLFPESSSSSLPNESSSLNGDSSTKKGTKNSDAAIAQLRFPCPVKLPQRIVIWISKVDPHDQTNPDPKGVGFYRPEFIPISSLFRKPKDDDSLDDSSSDDDGEEDAKS